MSVEINYIKKLAKIVYDWRKCDLAVTE